MPIERSTLAKSLVSLAQGLSAYVVAAEGNISARDGENSFLIKASGFSFHDADDKSFVSCDLNGNPAVGETLLPSIETPLHAWLYANYDFKYIAHTHPTNTLKILCSEEAPLFAKTRLFPDHVVLNGRESCFVEYSTPGEDLLSYLKLSVRRYQEVPKLILLRNHGVIASGNTMKECLYATQICEKAAEIYIGSKSLGMLPLTPEQKRKIELDKKEIHRKSLI